MNTDNAILRFDEKAAYALRKLYRRLGYRQYKMSRFEEYDLYSRNKDFLVSDGIITFTDTNGRLLALKPDVTLSILHNSKDVRGQIQKLYYNENVYRISKSSHNYKEIMQTGLECIGDIGSLEVFEVLLLAVQSLAEIDPAYSFELSHIGLLEAALTETGLTDNAKKEAIACINQKNADELNRLCNAQGLVPAEKAKLLAFTAPYATADDALSALDRLLTTSAAKTALTELRAAWRFLTGCCPADRLSVDFSVANDMNYYSGVVFRGYIEGVPTSVLSGGQYDKLMQKMGRKSGAIGFAVYLDTLQRKGRAEKQFDVDILLLAGDDMAATFKAAERLSADGSSVRVCTEKPDGLRSRKIFQMTENGVKPANEND